MKPAIWREILIYALVAATSLFLGAYVVHMLVGGLVSEQTEYALMGGVCALMGGVMAYMAWDVIRRRKS